MYILMTEATHMRVCVLIDWEVVVEADVFFNLRCEGEKDLCVCVYVRELQESCRQVFRQDSLIFEIKKYVYVCVCVCVRAVYVCVRV